MLLKLVAADPVAVVRAIPVATLAAYFREELIARPKYWAEQTGLEQLGYLSDLKPKVPLPKPSELQTVWETYATCDKGQIRKVSRAWEDFVTTTEIETLEEITPELCVAFRDDLHDRELSGKQQAHICGGIRRVVSFAISRALRVKELNEVLVYLKLLEPNESAMNLDPKPIELEDWRKLYGTSADRPEDRAMLLLMLNCALYCKEAAFLEWSDFTRDNCLLTNRKKTGKCIRAAKLWPETIEALKTLPRKGERLFHNYAGLPIAISGAQLRFYKLAIAAGLSYTDNEGKVRTTVTAAQMRDGAATAATVANCNEKLVNLLVGHRCGMADHYVKRNPAMVAPATEAVYAHYFYK